MDSIGYIHYGDENTTVLPGLTIKVRFVNASNQFNLTLNKLMCSAEY